METEFTKTKWVYGGVRANRVCVCVRVPTAILYSIIALLSYRAQKFET